MSNLGTIVRLLGSIREHLTTFRLSAGIAHVRVASGVFDGDRATVQLEANQLGSLAAALVSWAETLTAVTVTAWRPPHGASVHLTVTGLMVDAVPVSVYGAVAYADALFGDLQPGGQQGVALRVLRGWAEDSAVAA